MNAKGEFFESLKHLTASDTSTEVPASTLRKAVAIFPGRKPLTLFSLIPATAAMVRKGLPSRKFSYEQGDDVVQLEIIDGASSCQLSGFVHGIDDGPVSLYGTEITLESEISEGSFDFPSVPHGHYSLGFPREGETRWVKNLPLTPPTES